MIASRDQDDIEARQMQFRTDHTADTTGPIDDKAHAAELPQMTLLGARHRG